MFHIIRNSAKILGDSSALRSIFSPLGRANEREHVHNEINFPQAKLDSEINVRVSITEHGNQYCFTA